MGIIIIMMKPSGCAREAYFFRGSLSVSDDFPLSNVVGSGQIQS